MSAEIRRRVRRPRNDIERTVRRPGDRPLTIGLIAPPWVPVPPSTYGGTEGFLDTLARGLQAEGHQVRLYTIGESTCPVERGSVFESAPEPMGVAIHEAVHVRRAYEALAECDVIHDNTTVGPIWAAATHQRTPIVVTCHGVMSHDNAQVYADIGRWVTLNAISRNQRATAPGVPFRAVIHHGLDADRFPVGDGTGGYVMFLGRMSPDKGVLDAIAIARRVGMRLCIAAKMREHGERAYFDRVVEPHLGPDVEFLGEIDGEARARLLGGAVALLNPIDWEEPFGLVMIEAMACGTPVVSYARGAAPEIVVHGRTGFLCADVEGAAAALRQVGVIDRAACREHVQEQFSMARMAGQYVTLYRRVLADDLGGTESRSRRAPLTRSHHRTPPRLVTAQRTASALGRATSRGMRRQQRDASA